VSLEEAYRLARRKLGERHTVTVMPHAASTVPLQRA